MSKLYQALNAFEDVLNSYCEEKVITSITIKNKSFDQLKWVVRRELEISGSINSSGDAFGFEDISRGADYFKCRGITFIRGDK